MEYHSIFKNSSNDCFQMRECCYSDNVATVLVLLPENIILWHKINQDVDKPAHPDGLISTFVIHSLANDPLT